MGPNWFASVMGTGIVANAGAALPLHVAGLRLFATVVWAFASLWLVVLLAVALVHWRRDRDLFRDPVMVQFWGAPPMALLTVGSGTLLVGRDWIGLDLAVRVDAVLWCAGTAIGLATAVVIPYLMITRLRGDGAFGGWLMPVVPPMVSAAALALLVPHLPAGQLRLDAVLFGYILFGTSLFVALIIITQIWGRLVTDRPGPALLVPTLWIVLGPLGQSITAAHLLAVAARGTLPGPYATGAEVFGVFYGLPAFGFALLWACLALALTVRERIPFSLAWWSFTFPVGTVVTGATGLAAATGSALLAGFAVLLFAALVVMWATVLIRTTRVVGEIIPAFNRLAVSPPWPRVG